MRRVEVGFDPGKQIEKYKEKPYLAGLYDIRKVYPQVDELLESLEDFDHFTFQHSLRAEAFAWNVAEALEFSEEDKRTFCLTALMHDIGKLKIGKDLINKHPFEKDDIKKVKPHVVASFKKLYDICPDAAEIALRHHLFQKDFYPSDEEISQLSKIDDPVKLAKIERMAEILSMIDVFETRSGERPGKGPEPLKNFMPDLKKQFGSKDDEGLMWKLVAVLEKEEIISRFPPNAGKERNLFAKYPFDILEEYLESFEYGESHGIYEAGKIRRELDKSLTPKEKERMKEIDGQVDTLIKKLKETPEIRRLNGLNQLGGVISYKNYANLPEGAESRTQTFHTRHNHSELLAEQAKYAGTKLGLPLEEIKILVASAWLHDIGHPALSHVCDELLKKRGRGDHEERTARIISEKSGPIAKLLSGNGIDPEKVVETIREKGYLGQLQSIFDTLSYLVIDSAAVENPIYEDMGAELISDLAGINKEKKHLVVRTPELWQNLLEKRAEMMRDVYLHPANRRHRAAIRQLLSIAVGKNVVALDTIEKGVDSNVRMNLQSQVQEDRRAAKYSLREGTEPNLKEYFSLWGLAYELDVDGTLWRRIMFETESKLNDYLFRTLPPNKLGEILEQTAIVSPFDYTRKTITVFPEGAKKPIALQARNVKLRDEDIHYIAYIPKFIK